MTVPLHDKASTDSEQFVIAWLTPFFDELGGATDIKRRAGNPLPFGLVREVDNTENEQQISSYPLVSVHWLADTEDGCRALSRRGHRRMLMLAEDPLLEVDMGDGVMATLEWLETAEGPRWVDYNTDQIFRRVSRYRMGLPFVNVEDE